MTELRRNLRETGSDVKVYKNTLAKRALDSLNYDMQGELNGPKAMAYGKDAISPIKTLAKFAKELGYDEVDAKKVNFYDLHLSGSYSIKKTLPVFSDLKYDDLDVKNGTQALVTYAMFSNMTKEEHDFKYNSLLEYCKQDTWAMVVILDKIRKMIK